MGVRACSVTFTGVSGIRHSVDVEAESLFEAAVLAFCRFRKEIWAEQIGNGTRLEIAVREIASSHSLTMQQVERWLASPGSPFEQSRKAKLKLMLVQA